MSEVLAQLEKKGGGTCKKVSYTYYATISQQHTYTVPGKLRAVCVYYKDGSNYIPYAIMIDGDVPIAWTYQYLIMPETWTHNSITVRGAGTNPYTYNVYLYYE